MEFVNSTAWLAVHPFSASPLSLTFDLWHSTFDARPIPPPSNRRGYPLPAPAAVLGGEDCSLGEALRAAPLEHSGKGVAATLSSRRGSGVDRRALSGLPPLDRHASP